MPAREADTDLASQTRQQDSHRCRPRAEFEGARAALNAAASYHHGGAALLTTLQRIMDAGTIDHYNSQALSVLPRVPLPARNNASIFDAVGPVGPRCKLGMTAYGVLLGSLFRTWQNSAVSWQIVGRYICPACLIIVSQASLAVGAAHISGTGDEQKRLCREPTRRQRSVLFSIGSNDQWGFELAALESGDFDAVHAFDCTLPGPPKKIPPSITQRVHFHAVCLGATSSVVNGRRYASYLELYTMSGERQPPAACKIDAEGWEWHVLPRITGGPQWLRPQQIAFELHVLTFAPAKRIAPGDFWRVKTPGEVAALLSLLFGHGYLLISRHDNPACLHCSELVVARVCEDTAWDARSRGRAVDLGDIS